MRRHAPATVRNREPIAAVLARALPDSAASARAGRLGGAAPPVRRSKGRVLEIASGTGEHAAFLAGRFPDLEWQPSDLAPAALASIEAHRLEAGLDNLLPPLALDASADWAAELEHPIAAVLCINMIHISPWRCCLGLVAGAAAVLEAGGLLYLYGPYFRDGVETAPSNLAFDQDLRARDPEWGVRRLEDVVAAAVGFDLEEVVAMPANNVSVLLRRKQR